jgi:hypothetical protein
MPAWCRIPDRAGRDPVAQADQFTLDAPVAPGRVLRGQPQYQVADLLGDRWPSGSCVWVCPVPGDQLSVPAEQGGWGHEERRPIRAGQQPRQGSQYQPVSRFESGAVYLAAEHRHLVAEYQEFDILGSAIAGELGQHLQHLAKQQVHQRSAHRQDPRSHRDADLTQNRTSTRPNPIYEPDRCAISTSTTSTRCVSFRNGPGPVVSHS